MRSTVTPNPLSLAIGLALAAGLTFGACAGEPAGGPADPGPTDPGPKDPGEPVEPGPSAGPSDPAFDEAFDVVLTEAATMTRDAFLERYLAGYGPAPMTLGFDPLEAAHLVTIDEALELTSAEKAGLAKNGFVVSERLSWPTFGEALLTIYEKDLPILVTTDMILHALHRSYADILKLIEEQILIDTLDATLTAAHTGLADASPPTDPVALAALRDADLYLTVARSLLRGAPAPSTTGGLVDDARDAFLELVAGEQLVDVQIFGAERKLDFSQFKPRGHYTDSVDLTRYFQAMMWLGRVDLRFLELDVDAGAWVFHPRQLAVSVLLDGAVRASGALADWHRANDLITMLVGPVDYIDFTGVHRLVVDHDLADADAAATVAGPARDALIADLLAGRYGEQLINSHWLSTDPYSAEPTPLPPSFAFLGQRFIVDSYVMANVVYDTIVHDGVKVPRVLPDPLDVLFALGNDQVLPLLADELERFPYHGALHTLRFLVDYYDDAFWSSNIYNLWLSALRALNEPTRDERFPAAMRTDAWRDKTAHTQLASWAQLRHDTLLYAKQSYTGGVACEHPTGFVEPYPAFFTALEDLARVAGQTLTNVTFPAPWVEQRLVGFFDNWEALMGRLAGLAQKQLDGISFSAEEVSFLKSTIMAEAGCGEPVYSGWYPSLYFMGSDVVGEWKPTIADVHTNPNTGPLPGPNVLHVATAHVNTMILTAESCEGPTAFVGPVLTYYEVDPEQILRYSDQDWENMLGAGEIPPRPTWTSSYLVPAP